MLCPPLWSCLSLVSVLVSQLVSHLFWDTVSASLVLSFSSPWSCPPACLLGCVWSCFQRVSFVFRFCLPFQSCVSRLSLRWSGFDSCSLCDFTACMGMSLPSACSLKLVFGLVSSLRFYTSVCCACGLLSMYLWWKQLFFYGPPWRVTNNTTRHEKKTFLGVQLLGFVSQHVSSLSSIRFRVQIGSSGVH